MSAKTKGINEIHLIAEKDIMEHQLQIDEVVHPHPSETDLFRYREKDRHLPVCKLFCCSKKRLLLLTLFFALNFLLPFIDVATDINGGIRLVMKGHHHWGLATLTLTLMPFIGFTIVALQVARKKNRSDRMSYLRKQFKQEAWQHLPCAQPLR